MKTESIDAINEIVEKEVKIYLPPSMQEEIIKKFTDATKVIYEEMDDLEEEIKDLNFQLYSNRDADNEDKIELKNENQGLQEQLDELADIESFKATTIEQEQKNQVLADLNKNLSLEQLENLEKQAVALLKLAGKQYLSMDRIVTS